MEKLGIALITPNVIDRINVAKANNFQGIKKYLKRILLDFYSEVIIIF
jgi:hypothetical protein